MRQTNKKQRQTNKRKRKQTDKTKKENIKGNANGRINLHGTQKGRQLNKKNSGDLQEDGETDERD